MTIWPLKGENKVLNSSKMLMLGFFKQTKGLETLIVEQPVVGTHNFSSKFGFHHVDTYISYMEKNEAKTQLKKFADENFQYLNLRKQKDVNLMNYLIS